MQRILRHSVTSRDPFNTSKSDSNTTAPALAEVGKFSQTVRFNGSLFFQSPYKGPITPEVTKAWDEIEYCNDSFSHLSTLQLLTISPDGLYGLSPETVRKMGSSEDSVRFPPEYGGGYMAFLEVFHHIHCVVCCISLPSSPPLLIALCSDTSTFSAYYGKEHTPTRKMVRP